MNNISQVYVYQPVPNLSHLGMLAIIILGFSSNFLTLSSCQIHSVSRFISSKLFDYQIESLVRIFSTFVNLKLYLNNVCTILTSPSFSKYVWNIY